MSFSWLIFLLVLAVGVVQVAAGMIVSRCWPWLRERSAQPRESAGPATMHLLTRLQQMVTRVADDVDAHQDELREADSQLRAAREQQPAELMNVVLGTISQLAAANEELQNRLTAAEERLRQQAAEIATHMAEARSDPLTRLPNRRAFDDALIRAVAQWQRHCTPFALMILDMDHFKDLNDRYGHLAGDQVLRRLGNLLSTMLGGKQMVARIGGEEFAVLLPEVTGSTAEQLAERIREAVATVSMLPSLPSLRLTVSIGLTEVLTGDDPVRLVQRADEALYAAKRGGRNCTFAHNGQQCHRVEPSVPGEASLMAICSELRQRVAEAAGSC
jgi:diguanylate cyclase